MVYNVTGCDITGLHDVSCCDVTASDFEMEIIVREPVAHWLRVQDPMKAI